ncbi:MAG: TM2 domain-containing protein [Clostridia bacterium]|nr:TM2 domain-containing protein [Clostridia bacterium]
MYCKYCGEQLFDGQTMCVKCGNKIEEEKVVVDNNAPFSQPAKNVKKGNLKGKSKMLMIVTCAFLGFFGAHNFLMGENKKGIVKIVTSFFGVGVILAIIDLVKIVTDNYICNPDAFI